MTQADVGAESDRLLQDADLSRSAHPSLHATLRVTPEESSQPPSLIEVWRDGPERSLVRFADPSESARCLVRRADGTWLVTPGTRRPVKLGDGARARSATALDAVLSARYSTDYRIVGRTLVEGQRVRFDLVRQDGAGGSVAYTVHEPTRRVSSIEMRLPGGKSWLLIEVLEWQPDERPTLRRIRWCEPLRGGACAIVDFEGTQPVELTEAAFDPFTAAARSCRP